MAATLPAKAGEVKHICNELGFSERMAWTSNATRHQLPSLGPFSLASRPLDYQDPAGYLGSLVGSASSTPSNGRDGRGCKYPGRGHRLHRGRLSGRARTPQSYP